MASGLLQDLERDTDVGIVIGITAKELMEINVVCRKNDNQKCQNKNEQISSKEWTT